MIEFPIEPTLPGAAVWRQQLEAEARRLGFDLFGVTNPTPPEHFNVFARWLQAGHHGEMEYLASPRALERRADPRQILPECRSILVLGTRYPAPVEGMLPANPPGKPFTGQIASYAWGDDYHEVLSQRLAALVQYIEAQAGCPILHRAYTDTGPVLERDLAQRAGLGWIGKNTCLIHPHLGSYFFLAEILLDLELPSDPPFAFDRCGSCTRCLDACPTQCILPDRTLDARRCISYLTIELKGAFPIDLRRPVGDWIFGCDICQQVCPWNQRFAAAQGDPAFKPRPGMPHPELISEMALLPEEFSRKYRRNPVKRARRRGYLRNIAVALGNQLALQSALEIVTALAQALTDPEPLVRRHAAWALGQTWLNEAQAALRQALAFETDQDVRAEIQAALEGDGELRSA